MSEHSFPLTLSINTSTRSFDEIHLVKCCSALCRFEAVILYDEMFVMIFNSVIPLETSTDQKTFQNQHPWNIDFIILRGLSIWLMCAFRAPA